VIVGLIVFHIQQTYLLEETQTRLVSTVQSSVKNYVNSTDLTVLAENLSEQLRAMGADMFVQDAAGNLVMPSLGTGFWLDVKDHKALRESKESSLQIIGSDSSARMVYLAAIIDEENNILGSIEASLSMKSINDQLNALSHWLILIITFASGLAVVIASSLSSRITQPLSSLMGAVDKVRSGDLDARAHTSKVSELNQLATIYNQMLDQISEDFQSQERLVEAVRRFVGDASHELRSPLSVFRNSVDLLNKAIQQNDVHQIPTLLAQLRKEVDSMAVLVDSLLLLARFDQPEEATESLLKLEEVHPLPLLEEVFERSRLMATGQEIELIWPSHEIYPIWADREMLRRALNNIVENAINYTPVGKKITLSVENWNKNCCFVIEDEGTGITPRDADKILDRFYRSDDSRNRKIPGTGLGLSIVAAIIKAHDGEIKIESNLGQGTRVKFFIPQNYLAV